VLLLPVQALKIAEGSCQAKVLADVESRPLDLNFGFGPVGLAGFEIEAEVPGQISERAGMDDAASVCLAGDHRLHAVIEHLVRHTAQSLEGGHMTAQHGGQVLMQHEASPDQAAVAEHR
jgi:hypothetical protein